MAKVNSQNISTNDAEINLASLVAGDTSKYHIKWPVSETGTLYNTLLKALEDKDELTIAVTGMPEIGVSLLIYSLLGYFAYPSFKDAYNSNEFAKLIARSQIGQANTKFPKTYVFRLENGKRLRVVDLPCMKKGKAMDWQHLEKIFNHLANLETIDMFCFVFKANDNRCTQEFRTVIEELVKYFDRDITKHFTFCFTYGLNTDFDTNNAKGTVQSLFDNWSHSDIRIQVTDENCFCVDSKPFIALMNRPQDPKFGSNGECWEESGEGWKPALLRAGILGKYNTEHIRSIPDAIHTVEHVTTVLNTVTETPTEGLLVHIGDWLSSIGITVQIQVGNWKFWCKVAIIGLVILGFWKVFGGVVIMGNLSRIVEIAANMRAFIEQACPPGTMPSRDMFLHYLNMLKGWLDNDDNSDIVKAFGDCCRLFSEFLGSLSVLYTTCLKKAKKTTQTPKDISQLHNQLYEIPHFGGSIRAAISSQPNKDQVNTNDEEIIQLVLK